MKITGLRVLNQYSPTKEDMQRVAKMAHDDCPRRYCWWWHSSTFDWSITPADGCTFIRAKKPFGWKFADVPCRRAEGKTSVDHYERREPYLLADGFKLDSWDWNLPKQ